METKSQNAQFQECPVCSQVAYWCETDGQYQCSNCGFNHSGNEIEKDNSKDVGQLVI